MGKGKYRANGGQGLGPNGTCICIWCGYTKPHKRDNPCIFEICPNCNVPMTRKLL